MKRLATRVLLDLTEHDARLLVVVLETAEVAARHAVVDQVGVTAGAKGDAVATLRRLLGKLHLELAHLRREGVGV